MEEGGKKMTRFSQRGKEGELLEGESHNQLIRQASKNGRRVESFLKPEKGC